MCMYTPHWDPTCQLTGQVTNEIIWPFVEIATVDVQKICCLVVCICLRAYRVYPHSCGHQVLSVSMVLTLTFQISEQMSTILDWT